MRQATSKTEVSQPTIRDILNSFRYLAAAEARKKLGLSRYQFVLRIERGIFPEPTYIRKSGARFFDEEWVKKTQAIQNSSKRRCSV